MGRTPATPMSQLVDAAERFYEEKGRWPTVANLRTRHPASTDRLREAIANAKRVRSTDLPARYFAALAFLAGFETVADAHAAVEQLERTAAMSRLSKQELRAVLALQDPYGEYPPLSSLTRQQIRASLYNQEAREYSRRLANSAGALDPWLSVEQKRRDPGSP